MEDNSRHDGGNRAERWSLLNLKEGHYNGILLAGIGISLVTVVVLAVVFKWNQPLSSDENYVVNHELLGTYGDFFGGVIGTFFAILAALIMFATLKAQRELTEKSNQLQKNIADEARQSQERLAGMQSAEARLQRFNALFFELLSLFRSQRAELNSSVEGASFFDVKMAEMNHQFVSLSSYGRTALKAARAYQDFYLSHASALAPLFRSLYRMMDLIEDARIDDDERRQYAKIVRAQLGEGELFFLRYNAMTEYGRKFVNLITKYNLLKHLPPMSLMEFKKYRGIMDRAQDNTHLSMNILIQKLRRAIYDRTVKREEYDDLAYVRIEGNIKYEVSVNMADETRTVLKIVDHTDRHNKSRIFKAFTQFSDQELITFMLDLLKEIYRGSNFKTFNPGLNFNVEVPELEGNDMIYQASVCTQPVSGIRQPLRMSHPDWD